MLSNTLSHDELVQAYRTGRVQIHVDMSRAMHVCDKDQRFTKGVKFAHHFWKNAGCALPLVGVTLFFFVKWYWAVGALILGFMTMQATRKSSAQFVRDLALENEGFYYDMINLNVITTTLLES